MKRILGIISIVVGVTALTFAGGPRVKVAKVKPATYVVVKPNKVQAMRVAKLARLQHVQVRPAIKVKPQAVVYKAHVRPSVKRIR